MGVLLGSLAIRMWSRPTKYHIRHYGSFKAIGMDVSQTFVLQSGRITVWRRLLEPVLPFLLPNSMFPHQQSSNVEKLFLSRRLFALVFGTLSNTERNY